MDQPKKWKSEIRDVLLSITSDVMRKKMSQWDALIVYEPEIDKIVRSERERAKEEEREKTIKWLTNYLDGLHQQLYDELKDKIDYDSYSDDYRHGILRGYTLISRYLHSLSQTKVENKEKQEKL